MYAGITSESLGRGKACNTHSGGSTTLSLTVTRGSSLGGILYGTTEREAVRV
ncbi:MAG: hypothetical protein AVDCRST_MAG87-317 [uncultured Thermomicrobiales bacterium]|uniref:Uncharacterized protein n=1 Tax=uncultured Thermomicrobiales bacterium TaxID=1645740 RepID=A0A6J4UCL5_9BACT|nr:MAG: hypothetical protein AVDCRST_MAG87-317 [uncultured Thermomicrobiales bacterium]